MLKLHDATTVFSPSGVSQRIMHPPWTFLRVRFGIGSQTPSFSLGNHLYELPRKPRHSRAGDLTRSSLLEIKLAIPPQRRAY